MHPPTAVRSKHIVHMDFFICFLIIGCVPYRGIYFNMMVLRTPSVSSKSQQVAGRSAYIPQQRKPEGTVCWMIGVNKFVNQPISYIFVNSGWLEPLLDRIALDEKTVAVPVADRIKSDTMEFVPGNGSEMFCGFEWDMTFNWFKLPERERQRRKDILDPIR